MSRHQLSLAERIIRRPDETGRILAPAIPNRSPLTVVLFQASLETYRTTTSSSGKGHSKRDEVKYTLLNCDDHQAILAKTGRDIAEARPDITHQCLLTLLDSPLNKAGLLRVYIQTAKGVLIRVDPNVRIPRTFKRFSGLMVQLLHKSCIKGDLLKVLKPPIISHHLPPDTIKILISNEAPPQYLPRYLRTLPHSSRNVAVFIRATTARSTQAPRCHPCDTSVISTMTSRHDERFGPPPQAAFIHRQDPTLPPFNSPPNTTSATPLANNLDLELSESLDDQISISNYELSASVACGKVCGALEDVWNVF